MNAPSEFDDNEDNLDKDEGNVVTMVDVLREENELEEDANAVLGGADDKFCTYSKGYLYRQPLYACATCNPGNEKPAGICLACSYRCHEGHDLIELYTKRNFRCDCGNSLFPDVKCNLEFVKDDINSENIYNQNFSGTYCICNRPYPDPEDPVEDEMIQCILCEDWFHKRHLETKAPDDFGEMICQGCMVNHLFLWKYSSLCAKEKESEDESLNVSATENTANNLEEAQESKTGEAEKKSEVSCHLKISNLEVGTGSTFWPDGWREHLCRCQDCLDLYKIEKVSFLLSETDTIQHYESKSKESVKESQCERGLRALSSLDRIKQVEAIEGYNQMTAELMGYLQKFAKNRKVVREDDIREFFTRIQARKKLKVEVPHYCH